MEKNKRMQFYGGTLGACAPLLVFMCLMIVIAAMKKVSLVLFCMAGFAGLCVAFLLAKNKKEFEQAVVDGLKNDTLCVIIFAFLLAGILSQELRQSGLIQGLTWLVMKLGLSAGFLPLVPFLVCLLISTACGTSNGAIVAVLPVLLPVAATVGANPSVVVGAIVSGAIFGDNLAPISDTTIASALTQDAEQGILTYEDILALPPERIAAADYRALEGVNCIYVETEPDDAGYVERYWVSVSNGLLCAAEKLQGEDVVYRMAGMSVDSGNVAEDAFTLPDGTVLHEGALDGANR